MITNYLNTKALLPPHVNLIAVSKTKSIEAILELYNAGQRAFGENRVQELTEKHEQLPKDIQWHMIGHLQTNKVKYIAAFIHLIHSVDSLNLLQEINKQAAKNNRIINCLLQIYIANEETKFGFSFDEAEQFIHSEEFKKLLNVKITGLMGMATNTNNPDQIRAEFKELTTFFKKYKTLQTTQNLNLETLSMGMSSDFHIAIEEGSNMVRIGSLVFGK